MLTKSEFRELLSSWLLDNTTLDADESEEAADGLVDRLDEEGAFDEVDDEE